MPPVNFVGILCKIHAVLCSKIRYVHGIEFHDVRIWKFVYFRKIFRFLLHNTTDVTRGKGDKIPLTPNHCGGPKSHNNVIITFSKTVHLLPKDLRFEHMGAKHISCPRRHLTSLPPAHHDCLAKMAKFVCKNTCPPVANHQSQTI